MYKNNYKEKNGTIHFINKAVSNFIGEIEMTIPSQQNNFNQLPCCWASQLSSVNLYHAIGHIHNLLIEKIIVNTTTLNAIINDYNFNVKPKKNMDGLFKIGIKYTELSNKLILLGYKKIHQDTTFELI